MSKTFALALLAASARGWSCNDAGATETLSLQSLGDVDSLAVCNDGSTAAYYYKEGSDERLWLVYLGGGGWCTDAESCAARFNGSEYPHHDCRNSSAAAPCFMSSKDYPQECGKTGLFDSSAAGTGSLLADANKVYIPYCSSDGHMGDGEFNGFQFRGARILRATLRDLQLSKGLQPGHTLILAGGSAGARGAMVHLDEVAEALGPRAMRRGVRVLGLLDSNYYLDVPGFPGSGFAGFQLGHTQVLENFNASSVVGQQCGEAFKSEPWRCLFGVYRMPFVRTPYLMLQAQFDGWQLSHLVHGYTGIEKNPSFSKPELEYVEDFGAATIANLTELQPPSGSMLYSTACYNHHISEGAGFFSVRTSAGLSESDAVNVFMDGGEVSEDQLIDRCQGYLCGGGCSNEVLV